MGCWGCNAPNATYKAVCFGPIHDNCCHFAFYRCRLQFINKSKLVLMKQSVIFVRTALHLNKIITLH